jgi:hypothetical protein
MEPVWLLPVMAPPAPECPGPVLAEYVVTPDRLRLASDPAPDAIALHLASISTPVIVCPCVPLCPETPVWLVA